MKKANLFFIFTILISLVSCRWFTHDETENKSSFEGKICGNVVPASYAYNSRAAFPSIPDTFIYQIYAYSDTAGTVGPEIVDSDGSFIIAIPEGTWTVTAVGFAAEDTEFEKPIVTGSKENIVIDAEHPLYNDLEIVVDEITLPSDGATGTVNLPIKVEYTSSKIVASWKEGDISKTQTISMGDSKLCNFTMKADDNASSETNPQIPVGSYDVSFEFYLINNTVETFYYYCQETINVCASMETNIWVKNSDYADYLTETEFESETKMCMYINLELSKNFFRDNIFVSNTGNDSNSGTYYAPLKTLSAAIAKRGLFHDKNSFATIYLLSDVVRDSNNSSLKDTFINISSNNINLKICSYKPSESIKKVDANSEALGESGVVFWISSKGSTIILKDLIITGGLKNGEFTNSRTETDETAAVMVYNEYGNDTDTQTVVYLENCEITGNKCISASRSCLGVSGGYAYLYISGNTKIENNTAYAFIASKSKIKLGSGKIIIKDNKPDDINQGNVFVKEDEYISLSGKLETDTEIWFTSNLLTIGNSKDTIHIISNFTDFNTKGDFTGGNVKITSDQNGTVAFNDSTGSIDLVYEQGKLIPTTYEKVIFYPSRILVYNDSESEKNIVVKAMVENAPYVFDQFKLDIYKKDVKIGGVSENNSSSVAFDSSTLTAGKYTARVFGITNGFSQNKEYTDTFEIEVKTGLTKKSIISNGYVDADGLVSKSSEICIIPPSVASVTVPADSRLSTSSSFKASSVTLKPYALSQYEVSEMFYNQVMKTANSPYYKTSNSFLTPVTSLTVYDILMFCNELTKLTMSEDDCVYTINVTTVDTSKHITSAEVTYDFNKKGYRIPTFEEWEYAARGADYTATEWTYDYAGTNDVDQAESYVVCNRTVADNIGIKKPNSIGLYDMNGNISEVCIKDGVNYYEVGGHFKSEASFVKILTRTTASVSSVTATRGIRLCRTLK